MMMLGFFSYKHLEISVKTYNSILDDFWPVILANFLYFIWVFTSLEVGFVASTWCISHVLDVSETNGDGNA